MHFTVSEEGFLALPGDAFIAALHADLLLFFIFVFCLVLGKNRLPNGVRRFGASRGRPGRRLNRSVPWGFVKVLSVTPFFC